MWVGTARPRGRVGSVNNPAIQTHARGDGTTFVQYARDYLLVIINTEGGEETEGAQAKCQDGRT